MGFVKETVKVGVIGLGHRGLESMRTTMSVPGVEVVAICDLYEDRVEDARIAAKEKGGRDVDTYSDYKQLLARGDLDAVVIFTSWQTHVKIAVDAMKAGIYTAIEVGGATSVEECWKLVRAYEETGVPCMLLENVNYGRQGLTTLRMVKEGLFGELIYLTGAYQHDLRDEIGLGREIRHYRFPHFVYRNGELYPTHEIGPIAKYLDINRGNRFMTLTSTATKSRGLSEYFVNSRTAYNSWVSDTLNKRGGVLPKDQPDYDMIGKNIACGDVVNTTIKCAGGEVINIVHDCTLPRPRYGNRRIQGTKGIWMGDTETIYLVGHSAEEDKWESDAKYFNEFEHPLWTENEKNTAIGPHGGTDFVVMQAFIDAVKRQIQTPIDVYDAAAWMAITCLSEDSIALSGAPVNFPDFTGGGWIDREPVVPSKFALDKVYWECFE